MRQKFALFWIELARRWLPFAYLLKATCKRFLPARQLGWDEVSAAASEYDSAYIGQRVGYYNKMTRGFAVQNSAPIWRELWLSNKQEGRSPGNFFTNDLWHLLRPLKRILGAKVCADYLRGDIQYVPDSPSLVKSRPIAGDNAHSVILKLDSVRHYRFIKRDPLPFRAKKNLAVWRGASNTAARKKFAKLYAAHPLCDVALVDKRSFLENNYMSLPKQLAYKFIVSLEGHDVATNLKWIMSSNSLCFSPKLRFETWYMEGKLVPNFHFALLADDFSDLPEKINYYLKKPEKAEKIIANAQAWAAQFQDHKREDYIGRQVLLQYFRQSGQLPE